MTKNKTSLSISDVKHIAKLAQLGLSDKEVKKFQKQLSQILDFVNQLRVVDTKKVAPTSQVTGLENVFRDDVVEPSLSQEEVLSNAPDQHKGFFKVKAVLEQ